MFQEVTSGDVAHPTKATAKIARQALFMPFLQGGALHIPYGDLLRKFMVLFSTQSL
jgi:hypothetical protein